MAILNDGINGGFSGKVGSVVGYARHGKNIIRGLPKPRKKKKKPSPKQLASRAKFNCVQDFLKPLVPFVRVGFKLDATLKSITSHNAAKSYNQRNALDAEGRMDYSKAGLSMGTLAGVLDPVVLQDDAGLHFSWTNNEKEPGASFDDQVMLVAYLPEKNMAFYMMSGAKRRVGADSLEIPASCKGKEIHTWMSFISDDRQNISMSTYTGSLVF